LVKIQLTRAAAKAARIWKNWRYCEPDHPPCAACGSVITGVPLILKSHGRQIAFHIECGNPDYLVQIASEFPEFKPSFENSCVDCGYVMQCSHASREIRILAANRNIAISPEAKNEIDSLEPKVVWMVSFLG
jgi:hypothetical protein